LYTLSRKGVAHVASLGMSRELVPNAFRLDRLDDSFLEHNLLVARLWALFEAQVAHGALQACRWVPEPALRARRLRIADPRSGRTLPVLPDGYAELERMDGTIRCCFVEVDMGTLTLARLRRKVRAFEAYVAAGGIRQDWAREGCDFAILTHSWERLRNVWKTARQEVGPARLGSYVLITADALEGVSHAGEISWLTLDGAYVERFASPSDHG